MILRNRILNYYKPPWDPFGERKGRLWICKINKYIDYNKNEPPTLTTWGCAFLSSSITDAAGWGGKSSMWYRQLWAHQGLIFHLQPINSFIRASIPEDPNCNPVHSSKVETRLMGQKSLWKTNKWVLQVDAHMEPVTLKMYMEFQASLTPAHLLKSVSHCVLWDLFLSKQA